MIKGKNYLLLAKLLHTVVYKWRENQIRQTKNNDAKK